MPDIDVPAKGRTSRIRSSASGTESRDHRGAAMSAEYRIEYSLQRAPEEEAEFEEIGFGSSGAWSTIGQAAHMLISGVVNYGWETEPGMPDPDDIRAEIEGRDDDA